MQKSRIGFKLLGLACLILVYHLAIAGSETFSFFEWFDKHANTVQAFAALVALIISVYTFWRQKEMTKLQINLDLYEKRYALYTDVRSFLYQKMDFNYMFDAVKEENDASELPSESIYDQMRYLISVEDAAKVEEILVEEIGEFRKMMVKHKYHTGAFEMLKEKEKLQSVFVDQVMLMHSKIDTIFDRYINFKDI